MGVTQHSLPWQYAHELFRDDDASDDKLVDWERVCPGSAREGKGFADSTFWFGTEGAHTAQHYDTYGVNVVLQVHGRKVCKFDGRSLPCH